MPIISDLAYRPSDNKILIGTHGNGTFETVLKTLSTDSFSSSSLSFSVYPNPTSDELNIKSSSINFDKATFNIMDLNGKVVSKGSLENKKLDVKKLTPGVYLIDIQYDGLRDVVKFLKN